MASASWSAATSTAGASRSSWRSRGIGSTRISARACRACSRSGSTAPRSTTTCRSARRRTRGSSSRSTSTPACRSRRCRYEELEQEVERLARTWDDDLRDALVARVGADRGAALADRVRASVPRLLQVQPRLGPDRRRRPQARRDGAERRGVRRRSGQRVDGRAADAGQALQDRREGRSLGVHADPRGARAPRRRRGPDRAARRREGLHPRLRRPGLARRRARPGDSVRARRGHRSSRSGAARPSPTR